LAGVALSLILGLAPANAVLAATHWSALAGSDTPDHAIQGNAFYPSDLTIHVGDTVTWNANAGEVHTVSFGTPPPPGGLADATTRTSATAFDGSGWVNSGLLSTDPAAGGYATYTLTFTAAGDYTFHCLIHSTMQGTLHVLDSGTVPHDQAFYAQESISQQNQLLAEGRQVRAAGLSTALATQAPAVTVGDGLLLSTSSVAVLRFLPDSRTVQVGETVTWTNLDPETPHTVTFGPDPPGGPFGALLPIGVTAGHAIMSGPVTSTINSGFLAQAGPFGLNGQTFSVTFEAAGTYQYRCVLHDGLGMVGSITVLPAP
jgi:plastocyanin